MAIVPVVGGLSVLKREQAKSLIENRIQKGGAPENSAATIV